MESKDCWETFSDGNPPPTDLSSSKTKIAEFTANNVARGKSVVLITSGGTTVPLEHNTVRFVDNFSAGTRGSASAEHFLNAGYAVIFLHRSKSLEPFVRHIDVKQLLKSFQIKSIKDQDWKLEVDPHYSTQLLPIIKKSQEVSNANLLLQITFTTLSEYLHLLHASACILRSMGKMVMLYLAAAVSDFFIPSYAMATHKIASNQPLHLTFELSPKLLQPLVRYWIPDAFVVSFKLETDESILLEKSRKALDTYGHKVVIANLLKDRKTKVIIVDKNREKMLTLDDEEVEAGREIEQKIVEELVHQHCCYLQES